MNTPTAAPSAPIHPGRRAGCSRSAPWRALVGAGPGDAERVTLKVLHLMRLATLLLVDDLVGEALAGERVVRIKGGDPFVFGRGGEEADALRRRGVTVGWPAASPRQWLPAPRWACR